MNITRYQIKILVKSSFGRLNENVNDDVAEMRNLRCSYRVIPLCSLKRQEPHIFWKVKDLPPILRAAITRRIKKTDTTKLSIV